VAEKSIQSIVVTYKYRLLPNKRQHALLAAIRESQRHLYNGGLEHRIGAYRKGGKTITLYSQLKELTELRKDAQFSSVPANLQRWTLKRLDEAIGLSFGD